MTERVETKGAATRRYALTSDELAELIVVRGTVMLMEEKTVGPISGTAPSLYQRRFQLTDPEIIHDSSTASENVSPITFSGFTTLAPAQRAIDSRSLTLRLEGQSFFDSKLPLGAMDVLLLIGGPEIAPIAELTVRGASVESGIYKGQPVRVFLLEGADVTLSQALPSLVGWQVKPTVATAKAAIRAPHPLISLDALRIAAREGASDQVELLSRWLLHPSQPAGVKATAIELLGLAISQLPHGSTETNTLIETASAGWEAERAYQIDTAYLRTLLSIQGHIKKSNQLKRVEAIAEDYQIKELYILAKQLADSLQKNNREVRK